MADNLLSELFVKIGADTSKLKAGLASAESSVGKFGKSIMKHHKAIGMAMTALGGSILAIGVMSIKSYAQMGDAVQKMALRTGFSTEALSELKHAADISGASLELLEKGVRKMQKTISDAKDGLATYVRSFEKIGLTAEELMELSPEEQFEKITMAIAAVENPTLRAAVAMDIFGRAGTALLPMLAEGADGIARLRQEAHDLGIVFDQEAADMAAKFNDALTKLQGGITGIKMVIAEVIIPILMPLIEKFTEAAKKASDWMKENSGLAQTIITVVTVIAGLLVIFGPLLIFLPTIIASLGILGGAFAIITGPIGLMIIAIIALIAIGVLLWKNWDDIKIRIGRIWEGIKDVFKSAIKWITDKIQGFVDFWVNAFNKVMDFVRSVGTALGITAPVKAAAIPALGITAPAATPLVGFTHIPGFQHGGVVPGALGVPRLVVAEGGEKFAGRGGSFGDIIINVAGSVVTERDLIDVFREAYLDIKNRNTTTGF